MPVPHEMSRRTLITSVVASGTTSPLETPSLDMLGFESVLFIGISSVTSTAQHLKMKMSTASATAGMSDATGRVEQSVTGCLYYDAYRPTKRFVQGALTASGASAPARGIVAIQYGARSSPTTQPAGTTGIRVYSPGSGTATG